MGDLEPDFSGYATKANLKCSDGRTITPDAFKHQDKETVPLVWQHARNEQSNILGYAILEHRSDGVYCEGFFNDTDNGVLAKKQVQHGDIKSLSIYANQLVEKSKVVMHGMIREVSLVLAGANPGARIDYVAVQHSDDPDDMTELDDTAVIYTGLSFEHTLTVEVEEADGTEEDSEEAEHAEEGPTMQDIFNSLTEEQKNVVVYLVGKASGAVDAEHSDMPEGIQDILEGLDEDQSYVVHHMLETALTLEHTDSSDDEDSTTAIEPEGDNTAAHADNKEGSTVTHNVFEQGTGSVKTGTSLSHSDQQSLFSEAMKRGSRLKDVVNAYALEHGIDNIDILFPDARAVTSTPEFLSRRSEWVSKVLSGTRHTPFAKIKSLTANLTLDEARAKGYVKGDLKKEEFFPVAKRETMPQTIYKKQKLDRDDIIDITDFDVVAWIKGEMRLMLDEELARAILIGDGRDSEDEDKIREDRIRPIATDNDLFVTRISVNLGDADSSAEEIVDAVVRNRRHYRGTGTPVLFTSESLLSDLLLIKDTLGRRIYADVTALKAAMRVSDIITVEVMDDSTNNVLGIIVNLQDYVVGADKGGDVALFDDFDIDYNQYKYLIETRCSGALVKAKSALVLLKTADNAVAVTPVAPSWDDTTKVATIPTTTGVVYTNKLTGAVITGAQPALAAGESLRVEGNASGSGYYLASDARNEFLVTYEAGVTNPGF